MTHNITVEGGTSVRLLTAGKYCDRDIVVTATGGGDNLAKQLIERTITNISDDSTEIIGAYAFASCLALTEVSFTNCTEVGVSVFYSDSGLIRADFPKLLKTTQALFSACSALKDVNLPVTNQLRSSTFDGCQSLKKIDLPKVTIINKNVFAKCSMLTAVILRSNTVVELSSANSFNNTPIANGTGYIYVPKTLADGSDGVTAYKAATNWSVYANQFRAIEDYPEICGG